MGVVTARVDRTLGRRGFVKALLGFSAVSTLAMIGAPIIGFLVPTRSAGVAAGGRLLVGTTDDLPVGAGKVVAMGDKPVMVVDTAQCVKAYSAVCTHLGCIVGYDSRISHIVCPCHDGHFDPADGTVISGPPPKPLPPVTAAVEGTNIYLGGET